MPRCSAGLEGNNLLRQGQVEQALEVFSQAVQAQPDSRHAHAGLERRSGNDIRAPGTRLI